MDDILGKNNIDNGMVIVFLIGRGSLLPLEDERGSRV